MNQKEISNLKIFSLLFLLFLSPTHARLGESLPELNARYGNPIKDLSTDQWQGFEYEKNGFKFDIILIDGKAECLSIVPAERSLNEVEIKSFLEKNSKGSGFIKVMEDKDGAKYLEEDTGITALFLGKGIIIQSKKFRDAVAKKAEENTKKKLDGF